MTTTDCLIFWARASTESCGSGLADGRRLGSRSAAGATAVVSERNKTTEQNAAGRFAATAKPLNRCGSAANLLREMPNIGFRVSAWRANSSPFVERRNDSH